jgi:hypothetical protein
MPRSRDDVEILARPLSRFSGIIPAQKQRETPRRSLTVRVSESYSVPSVRAVASSPANIDAVFGQPPSAFPPGYKTFENRPRLVDLKVAPNVEI